MNARTTTMGNEERLLLLFKRGELFVDCDWRIYRFVPVDTPQLQGAMREAVSVEYEKGGRRGHLMTRVYLDGDCVRVSSHRLIYRVFVGPIPAGFVVDHMDGDKQNNDPANLQAVSPRDNTRLAIRRGHRGQYGERNPRAKLMNDDALLLLEVMASGVYRTADVARHFGLHPSTVRRIVSGERRRCVS